MSSFEPIIVIITIFHYLCRCSCTLTEKVFISNNFSPRGSLLGCIGKLTALKRLLFFCPVVSSLVGADSCSFLGGAGAKWYHKKRFQ